MINKRIEHNILYLWLIYLLKLWLNKRMVVSEINIIDTKAQFDFLLKLWLENLTSFIVTRFIPLQNHINIMRQTHILNNRQITIKLEPSSLIQNSI